MNESIGQIIHQARTAKKLSLGQVTRAIHVREGYLDAIERDALSELPSPVQAKGFIRLYWSFLGLDELQLFQIWNPASEVEPEKPKEVPPTPSLESTSTRKTQARKRKISPEEDTSPELQIGKEDRPLTAADQSFILLGKSLRDQRERLSLTIENIETYTHIPVHYLRAIESGNIDDLPSPVQGRGMISNYASFLDMDIDEVLLHYADGLQTRRDESQQEQEQNRSKRKPFQVVRHGVLHSIISLDVLLVGLVIVAAVVALIWGGSNILAYQSNAQRTTTAIPISDILIHTDTVTPELTNSTIEPATATVASNNPVIIQSTGSATFEAITGTPGTPGVYPVQVFVVALQRSYLQVIVDGKTEFNGRITMGNPYSFNGQNQIELIVGNAAAVQIIHNQRNLGSPGVVGEVIHLVFGKDAYGTPTHTPTATPTKTLVPTRTPKPSNTYPPTRTPTDTRTPWPTSTPKPTNTPKGTVVP